MTESEKYMTEALAEAEKALAAGEVPIGAVMVRNGEIIARGHNLRNTDKNPLRHAEIDVIDAAAKIVGDWRLEDCVLYVTVEPCPMCAGAIVQARIPRVVFGTRNIHSLAKTFIFQTSDADRPPTCITQMRCFVSQKPFGPAIVYQIAPHLRSPCQNFGGSFLPPT